MPSTADPRVPPEHPVGARPASRPTKLRDAKDVRGRSRMGKWELIEAIRKAS